MTVDELRELLGQAPGDAIVVTYDGGHDADEVIADGIEVVRPGECLRRPYDIPDDATFVRLA